MTFSISETIRRGMSYIAYFFMVLGDYSESAAIFSHAFLVLCAFFPLITALSKSSAVITYASSFVIFIFVAVYGQGWATVLIDQQIGALLVAAVGIMWVCRNSIERLFLLLPVLSFLVLTKAPGIQFAALFVIAVVIMDLSNYKNTQFPQLLRRGYLPVISGILVSYFAWKGFVALKGISPSVASASVFELLNKVRFCCETNRETLVVAEFSRRLFGSLNAPGSIITAAFFATLFIVPFIKDKAEKIRYLAVSLFLIAGSCLYLVMSLLYYLYSFSEQEALVLTSFERYFIPFIFVFFAQIIVGFSLVINQASGKYNASKIAFVSFVLVFVIFHFESYSKALRNYGSEFIGERVAIKSRVKEFVSNSHPHSSVLIVWQNDTRNFNGFEYWIARHEFLPRKIVASCYSFSSSRTELRPGDCHWANDTFLLAAVNHNYVAILNGVKDFKSQYPEILFSKSNNLDNGIFSVDKSNYHGNPDNILKEVSLIPFGSSSH